MRIVGFRCFACAKGVVGAKSNVCDRGMLQFGSDMQKGSFFNQVSDHGGVLISEYPPPLGKNCKEAIPWVQP